MESIKTPIDAIALLSDAIIALDDESALCEASDSSTEDPRVLEVLRHWDFEVILYNVETEGEEIEHQFILENLDSRLLLSADVIALKGYCSVYTFARIAPSEQ